MTFRHTGRAIVLALSVMLACGCASTPKPESNSARTKEISKDNLDLLFATEFPVATKDEALHKAAVAYRDGDLDKSQFFLVKALEFDTKDADILAQIGDNHAKQNNVVLASRAYSFALQSQENHAQSLQGLGLLFFKTNNVQKAREILERAVSSDPELWRSHNALGVLEDRRKNHDAAMRYYDQALAIKPKSNRVLINRGYSLYLQKKYREAAKQFFEVAERSDNPKAWQNLALTYARQGWYEEALDAYLHVLERPEAYNEMGMIAMDNGDTEVAQDSFEKAIRLSPSYFPKAEENLALLRKSKRR